MRRFVGRAEKSIDACFGVKGGHESDFHLTQFLSFLRIHLVSLNIFRASDMEDM